MLISVLVLSALGSVAALIWAIRIVESRRAVKVERGMLFAGKEHLVVSAISRIQIAPLYDVAPADDLWMFEDKDGRRLSFFNRAPGATAALARLETELHALHSVEALNRARDESIFEQPVVVWTNQAKPGVA